MSFYAQDLMNHRQLIYLQVCLFCGSVLPNLQGPDYKDKKRKRVSHEISLERFDSISPLVNYDPLTLACGSQATITPRQPHILWRITWPTLYLTSGGRGLRGSVEAKIKFIKLNVINILNGLLSQNHISHVENFS